MTARTLRRLHRLPFLPLLLAAAACGSEGGPPPDSMDASPDAVAPPGPPADPVVARFRARLPDSVLVRAGACPFECCVYGRWASRQALPLRAAPRGGDPVVATVPPAQAFHADSGFVRIEEPLVVVVTDSVSTWAQDFGPGDTLVVLDYQGEGTFNVWHDGVVVAVSTPFWAEGYAPAPGEEHAPPELHGRYRVEWWVHATAPGGVRGWFPADSVETLEGADACGSADPALLGWQPGEVRPTWPNAFDPGELDVGDRFLEMELAEKAVGRTGPDSVWTGTVRFRGPVRLDGVYQPHFDAPEVDAACLDVAPESRQRLPAFLPDDLWATGRRSWLCFQDPERARRLLGPDDPPRHVTVVVDDYLATRLFTDAWDTAELVEVVDVGAEAPPTLRMTVEEAWGR